MLFFPMLYEDMVSGYGALGGWNFPPSSELFPMFPVYCLMRWLAGDIYHAIGFTLASQVLMGFALTTLIFGRFLNAWVSLLVAWVMTMLQLILSGHGLFAFPYALVMTYHYGCIINGLCIIYLTLVQRSQAKRWLGPVLCCIVMMGYFSDRMLVVFPLVPLACVLVLDAIAAPRMRIISLRLVAWMAIGCMGGHIIYEIIYGQILRGGTDMSNLFIPTMDWSVGIGALSTVMMHSISRQPVLSGIYVATWALSMGLFCRRMANKQWSTAGGEELVLGMTLMSIMILNVVTQFMLSPSRARYQVPLYFSSLLMIPLGCLGYLGRFGGLQSARLQRHVVSIAVACLCLVGVAFAWHGAPRGHYYPGVVRCIDRMATERNLRHGVGQYWDAKMVTVFSQRGVTMAQFRAYRGRWIPFNWISTVRQFRKHYDFAVLHRRAPAMYDLDEGALIAANGPPDQIIECEGRRILVYEENGISLPRSRGNRR